jgi:hypothetical protein
MSLKRRQFLMFMGATAGATALGPWGRTGEELAAPLLGAPAMASGIRPFAPVEGPMPMPYMSMSSTEEAAKFSQYVVQDDLVLPEATPMT